MQKIAFSVRRTLACSAIGVLGLLLNVGGIYYFFATVPNFSYLQLASAVLGTIALSSGIQYFLFKLVKRHMP